MTNFYQAHGSLFKQFKGEKRGKTIFLKLIRLKFHLVFIVIYQNFANAPSISDTFWWGTHTDTHTHTLRSLYAKTVLSITASYFLAGTLFFSGGVTVFECLNYGFIGVKHLRIYTLK